MTKIKICGNTNSDDVKLAIQLGADFIGFIFAESKRKISPETAQEIMKSQPGFQNFVGVFANQRKEEVEKIAEQLSLKWLQFHGDETARYCGSFSEKGYKIIKTFRIKDPMSLKRIDEYDTVDAFLFDTYVKGEMGGTGMAFDWHLIENKPYITEKLFLAGGLTVSNVADAIKTIRPYAVDVASGVESSPGVKDHKLLEEFIRKVKSISNPEKVKSQL